jgi:hypothetical protein
MTSSDASKLRSEEKTKRISLNWTDDEEDSQLNV